jgi:hypothetical protein
LAHPTRRRVELDQTIGLCRCPACQARHAPLRDECDAAPTTRSGVDGRRRRRVIPSRTLWRIPCAFRTDQCCALAA